MLRWAVLGTGFISNAVIDAIAQSDGSRVELVAGRDPNKVRDFQQRHNIARGATVDQAVSDQAVDVVYIGLPNHQHHPYIVAAAQAGKAVLSEKSLATNLIDAWDIADALNRHQTFFVEGLMYLAHPLYQRFCEVLESGRLGRLRSINARYAADIADVANPLGRGTIFNLGCYPVSLAQLVVESMLGEDAFKTYALSAVGVTNADDGTVCDAAAAVRFRDGVVVTLQSSDNYGNTSDFSIAGDNGVLRFETNPWLPVAGENVLRWHPYEGADERIVVTDPHDAFYHQIKMVECHVAAGDIGAARPSPRLSDSLDIMQVLTDWEAACLAPEAHER